MTARTLAALSAAALLCTTPAVAQTPASAGGTLGFYRYPALRGDVIVFAGEGDLWSVPATGGTARRLTTHPAEETDPVISRDGRTVAFTASYEGPAELYTMPIEGGRPTRWTYEGEPSVATAWAPDGRLVYTTRHYSTLPQNQLVSIDLTDGARERIPLYTASEGTYDDTGSTLFFVRPAFHNNVTKRYKGGTARDVWKFQAGATEAVELTGDYDGESHSPMFWRGRVYFVSDRDGTMNLWSMNPDGGDVRQHTRHSGWDVKNPELDAGRVVYQLGADLWIYDVTSDASHVVPITLASDFDQLREKWVDDPMEYLSSVHLSPDGDRVVLTARGRVFVAPARSGRLMQASTRQGVRYWDVTFAANGDTLLGLSDQSGELEWVTLPANGIGEGRRVTDDGTIQRFDGVASPDGSRLAYTDNNRDLWVLEVATGRQTRVSEDREGVGDFAWSPDSRWLAFEETARNTFVQVKLFGVADGARAEVTSDRVNSGSPAWDPKGDFLYFVSDRNLESSVGSPWGTRQPEPYFAETDEIFQVALRAGVRSPFIPADELTPREAATRSDASQEPPARVDIQLDGLATRLQRVPVPAGNYGSLNATGDALYFMSREAGQFGGGSLTAVKTDPEDHDPIAVAEGVSSYEISMDRKKLLVRQRNDLFVIDARPAAAGRLADHRVDLSGWSFRIDQREDWRNAYLDLWRQERDFFYDPGMHGNDWEAVRDKYLPLVDRVTTRDELSDVVGRFVGELSALHTAVRGGDVRTGPEDVGVASLGARIVRTARGDRIDYIYKSDPDYPDQRSPLADPRLGISEGDVIEAVNGTSVLAVPDLGALLRNQAGEPVRLHVQPAAGGPARDVMVTPIGNESGLRYSDWEYTRRMAVEDQGRGRIGYVHLRATTSSDITQWYRDFYPVFDRQGLIIDVRRNNGGNIDSFLLEKLARQVWMYWKDRVGQPYWNMPYAFRGHMVVLVDQNTASDGEAFAEGFRRLGLGEVIGMRTWGGEIWLSNNTRSSDGGLARTPQSGVYGPEREWLVEQVGVIPDIEVDNLPHATFEGQDAQLDAAIGYLQQRIAEDPRVVPPPPPYPNKAFQYRVTDEPGGRRPGGGR